MTLSWYEFVSWFLKLSSDENCTKCRLGTNGKTAVLEASLDQKRSRIILRNVREVIFFFTDSECYCRVGSFVFKFHRQSKSLLITCNYGIF